MPAIIDEVRKLPVEERMELLEQIWDSIAEEPGQPELTDAQKRELQRRAAAYAADPGSAIPWEEVKAAAPISSQRL